MSLIYLAIVATYFAIGIATFLGVLYLLPKEFDAKDTDVIWLWPCVLFFYVPVVKGAEAYKALEIDKKLQRLREGLEGVAQRVQDKGLRRAQEREDVARAKEVQNDNPDATGRLSVASVPEKVGRLSVVRG